MQGQEFLIIPLLSKNLPWTLATPYKAGAMVGAHRRLLGVLGDRGDMKSGLLVLAGNEDDNNTANDDDQPFAPWVVSVAR
ncbi:hypothetical protein Tco_0666536 [Tanacetum coccineum]